MENRVIGGCGKHPGQSMIDCPLCFIEDSKSGKYGENSAIYKKLNYNYAEPINYFTSLDQLINKLKIESSAVESVSKHFKFAPDVLIKHLENTKELGYELKLKNPPQPGPETNPLLINVSETFNNCYELLKSKNNDYAGEKTQDPYSNFRKSEAIGVRTEKGILVRMMDKMSRVSNLIEQDALVKSEKIEDTLDDLINYAAILKSYIKENKKKNEC